MTNPIGWTDETWNPVEGCKVCSPGCANCYAMRMAGRFSKPGEHYHGLVTIGKNKRAIWTGEARLDAGKLAKPLGWRKPRRVFVNSMSDLFYEEFTNEQIAAVFGVMAACPQHQFQVLTKRAKRMREWFAWLIDKRPVFHRSVIWDEARKALDGLNLDDRLHWETTASLGFYAWPLPNVWLGVSAENQAALDDRLEDLLACPAAIYFLSIEPMIGPIDADRALRRLLRTSDGRLLRNDDPEAAGTPGVWRRHVDWVIAGCESGPGARAAQSGWFERLRDQCHAAGVPFYLKQAMADNGTGQGSSFTPAVSDGFGSDRSRNGLIKSPYLRGRQHLEFPRTEES